MGHGQKNHVGNAMYKKAKTNLGAAVISGALGDNALSQEVLSLAVNQIETVQISRNDEKEADKLSFDYIYRAGYNPGATAAVWQRVIEKTVTTTPPSPRKSSPPPTTLPTASGETPMKSGSPHFPKTCHPERKYQYPGNQRQRIRHPRPGRRHEQRRKEIFRHGQPGRRL